MHRAETVAKAAIEENRLKLTVVPDLGRSGCNRFRTGSLFVCTWAWPQPERLASF